MCLPEVISEDPRFIEKDAPPLHEEFPAGTKVFFLGDHAYGVAAQVVETAETTMSVMLAESRSTSNHTFIARHALSKIASSFMVFDGKSKINLTIFHFFLRLLSLKS